MEIKTNIKRGKSRVKKDIGIRDFYTLYSTRELNKDRKPKDYKLYSEVIKEANKLILDKIVNHNEVIKLPYRLGLLGIIKYEVNFDPNKQSTWKVNYQESKRLNQIVYYEDPFRYKWKWEKSKRNCLVVGKRWYRFQPSRLASRMIPKAIKENSKLDYCNKLV